MDERIQLIERLLQRTVMPDGPDGCWLHQNGLNRAVAATNKSGYPQVSVRGKSKTVHRLAHQVLNPDDPLTPEKPFVLHWCGNSRCWRPSHLRAGSASENVKDAVRHGTRKGRPKCGTYAGSVSHYRLGIPECDPCGEARRIYRRACRSRHRLEQAGEQ